MRSSEDAPIPALNPEMKTLDKYKSPCVSVCKYNSNNYCIGCKRHMTEILDWFNYSEKMKKAILKDLNDRQIV